MDFSRSIRQRYRIWCCVHIRRTPHPTAPGTESPSNNATTLLTLPFYLPLFLSTSWLSLYPPSRVIQKRPNIKVGQAEAGFANWAERPKMTRRRAEYCGNPPWFADSCPPPLKTRAGPDLGKTWGLLQIFSGQPRLFGAWKSTPTSCWESRGHPIFQP